MASDYTFLQVGSALVIVCDEFGTFRRRFDDILGNLRRFVMNSAHLRRVFDHSEALRDDL